MSIVMSMPQYTLPDDSSYDTYGSLQVGSIGNINGDPTQVIGDTGGDENWGSQTWEDNASGGFDTGIVSVAFDVQANGDEILTTGNGTQLAYQSSPIGDISSVVLEAGVTTSAEASWSNVKVEFLKAGSIVETVSPTSGPTANSTGSGSAVCDQTMTVTPSTSDCDEAIVFGSIRLVSPNNASPASNAMFCNVFVNGTA